MKSHDVFTVSSRGQAELHGAASTLSSDQLASMVRFDGNLTWGEVQDRPVHVVPVEDEPLLARFVHSLLTLNGFDVRMAGNREGVSDLPLLACAAAT
jgi:hypothetical protein